MAGRLFLHVGLQKTGTSYLQGIVFASVEQLAAQGVAVLPPTKRETFWLMLDVRGRYRPEFDPPAVARAVSDLAVLVEATSAPTALVTEESLGPASGEQVERLLAACGEREVHVVVTVRDLARQVPSAWQESLKAGSSDAFATYLTRLRRQEDRPGAPLWRHKDVPGLLRAWAEHVPAERIHVVTVPPPGSDPTLLLERFCTVLGVDPEPLQRDVVRKNESLKHVAAEVLRRVNAELAPTHRRRDVYGDVGKRYLSTRILAQQPGEAIRVPAEHRSWVREVSQRHVDHLASGGYDVVGDLADLLPSDAAFGPDGAGPSEAEVSRVATTALAVVVADEMDRRRAARAARGAPGGPVARRSGPVRVAQRVRSALRR
jgi:hypothetical protein